MNTINFTKRALESLPVPNGERYTVYHDAGARGLGLNLRLSDISFEFKPDNTIQARLRQLPGSSRTIRWWLQASAP